MPVFDLVIFGGTGDLACRKLIPALFNAHRARLLHARGRILATGTEPIDRAGFIAMLEARGRQMAQVGEAGTGGGADADWDSFLHRLDYLQVDATQDSGFEALAAGLSGHASEVVVCYLATAPHLFAPICAQLARVGLSKRNVRVVLEKPLGHDLESSEAINDAVARFFEEDQIYRIDHYLGKEPVQNLMAIRFGNILFEPFLRREWVRDVQITIAEELGVEQRGTFYDRTGALRDMLQSHLLQLLCMVAMEPPATLDADAIRDEKLKVLKALRPMSPRCVAERTVRGQYRQGAIDGRPVPGYRDEPDVAAHSQTETFVAVRADIANWRWAGVPFYLRTGKRMASRLAEIVIHFHRAPHELFPRPPGLSAHNRLVITLQPDESIRLYLLTKTPGDTIALRETYLDLDLASSSSERRADAYERLLLDAIHGRLGLFVRRDEQAQAWHWVKPILQTWSAGNQAPKPYTAGTWGPAASSALLSRDGVAWHEEA
ncbi:glucose-6-phosphate dehydrogenase [Cupriavidus necator]|uniref:glucose-6-phosphate dehydrogenase n=1 Tax=Cupriavidus necator TaxID=106590 RepID=UPI003ECE3F0A